MNERIFKLAEEAGFYVANGTYGKQIYIPTTNENITDSQLKFAELIIKECTGRLRDIDWGLAIMEEFGAEPTCLNDVSLFAAIDIEEHFGVE